MIFRDRLEVMESVEVGKDPYNNPIYEWQVVRTISAHVDYTSSSVIDDNNRFQVESKLVAYCKPFPYDVAVNKLRWQGTEYQPDGSMLERIAGGRPHHVEIPLRRVTG